ncbi:uncharacterized protein [Argopecten irradians]|uniref:uncharacterized protein n=1 Tax=Argopecten irradians TaxID=31199 RepID=UPI00371E910B
MMDPLGTESLEMECDEEPDDKEVFQTFLISKGNNEVEITDQEEMFISKEDAGLSDVPVVDMTVDLEEFHEENTNEQDKQISDVKDEDISDKDGVADDEDWAGRDGESLSESSRKEASDEEVQKELELLAENQKSKKEMCVNEKAGAKKSDMTIKQGYNGRISFITIGKDNNFHYRHKVEGSKSKAMEEEMNLLARNSKKGDVPERTVDDSPGQGPAPRLCPVSVTSVKDGPKDNCSQSLADMRAKRRNESTKPGTHVINSTKSRPSIFNKSPVVTQRVKSGETKTGEGNSYRLACEVLNIGDQSLQDSSRVKQDNYSTISSTDIAIKEEPKSDSEDIDVGLPSRNVEKETRDSNTTFSTTEISIKEEPKSDVDDLDIQESSSDRPERCGMVISEEPSNFLYPNTDHSYSFPLESCKEGYVHDEVCESSAQTFNTKLASDLNFSLSSKSSNDLQASSFKSSASMTRSMPVDVERTSNPSQTKFHLSQASLRPTVSSVTRNIPTNPQSNRKKMVFLLPTLEHSKPSHLFHGRTINAQTQCLLIPDQSTLVKQKKEQSTTKHVHTQCAIMTTALIQSNVKQEKNHQARKDSQMQCLTIPSFPGVKRKRKTTAITKDAQTQCAIMVPHRHSVKEGLKSTTKIAQTQCTMAYYSNQDHKSSTKDAQTQYTMTFPPTHTTVNCKKPKLTTKDAQVQCVMTLPLICMYSTDENYETRGKGIQCSMTPIPQHVIVETVRPLSKQTTAQSLKSRIESNQKINKGDRTTPVESNSYETIDLCESPPAEPNGTDSCMYSKWSIVNSVGHKTSATKPLTKSEQLLKRKSQSGNKQCNNLMPHRVINSVIESMLSHHRKTETPVLQKPMPSKTSTKVFPLKFTESYRKTEFERRRRLKKYRQKTSSYRKIQ